MSQPPVKQLPDVDTIHGVQLDGQIFSIQYQNALSESWFDLSMSLENAQLLLVRLADLPDADRIFQRAREFRRQNPIV